MNSTWLGGSDGVTSPPLGRHSYAPDTMANPTTGWAVPAIAAYLVSTNDDDILDRLFDPASEEGVGTGQIAIPVGASQVRITTWIRAETAPAAARSVGRRLYGMTVDGTAGAWSAAVQLADTPITTDEAYVKQTEYVALGDLNLVQGELGQLEFTRDPTPVAGTNLTGDAALALILIEFV